MHFNIQDIQFVHSTESEEIREKREERERKKKMSALGSGLEDIWGQIDIIKQKGATSSLSRQTVEEDLVRHLKQPIAEMIKRLEAHSCHPSMPTSEEAALFSDFPSSSFLLCFSFSFFFSLFSAEDIRCEVGILFHRQSEFNSSRCVSNGRQTQTNRPLSSLCDVLLSRSSPLSMLSGYSFGSLFSLSASCRTSTGGILRVLSGQYIHFARYSREFDVD
jgi:hypothetical protein